MSIRSKTIRRMPPNTRKLARLINELKSTTRRLQNLMGEVQSLESELGGWLKWEKQYGGKKPKVGYESADGEILFDGVVNVKLPPKEKGADQPMAHEAEQTRAQ